ncbi:extracellular solute-binding protein [Dolichospermum circinale CS-534/05]|uniref:extracellular solute-binding protein n=1 Tax=Dolichospermum circinale TaxID=109265 RepID=UPI00232FAAF9|nr:extracellular solute-binding protein [Dolichospermum circinale]MDB9491032.1 extracellular solute-binding protein [Dolichospermum circinale CS-534/05]
MKNPNFLNQLSGLLQRITPTTHKLTITLFTVALGLSVTLYACQSSAQKEITLCFAVPGGNGPGNEIPDWEQLTNKFNNDNKGKIKIELNKKLTPEKLKVDYSRSLKELSAKTKNTNCQGKDIHYDLVYTDIIWLPEFAQYLLPLDKHFKEGELQKDFLKTEIDNGQYPPREDSSKTNDQTQLYRIPFRTDVGVLYYNEKSLKSLKLLKVKKVPATPEDLIKTFSTSKFGKEDYGYLWQANEEGLVAMFVEVLHAHGGFWVDKGKVGLGEPEAIKAVEFLKRTISDQISALEFKNEEEAIRKFKSGKAVFLRNWPAAWAQFQGKDSEVKDQIGIAPVIGGKGCHGGWGLAIAKNIDKERQEAAIKAVKFLTSRESQLLFTLSHGSVPTRKDLFFDPLIVSRYSHYPQLFNMVNNTVSRPRLAKYEKVSNILQKNLQKAFDTKTKDDQVEGIMKKASEQTEKCLKNQTECEN